MIHTLHTIGIYSCMLRFDSNRTDAGGQAGRTYRSDQRRR